MSEQMNERTYEQTNEERGREGMNTWTKDWISEWMNFRKFLNEWVILQTWPYPHPYLPYPPQQINESVKHRINKTVVQQRDEIKKRWTNKSMNQWIRVRWTYESLKWAKESMNQLIDDTTIQWVDELMNQWLNDSMRWTSCSIIKSIKEPMNRWITEPRNQCIKNDQIS